MKDPNIIIQIPETLGSNGIIGLYGKLMGFHPEAMKEGMDHIIMMVLPRPISLATLLFITEEIRTFRAYCLNHISKEPVIQII